MDPQLRFAYDDLQARAAYCDRVVMRWLGPASLAPLRGVGELGSNTSPTIFSLSLKAPDPPSCAKPSSMRPLPALPFGVVADYALVQPIQTGRGCNSQVWLAAPSAGGDLRASSTKVVLKFIIPSLGDFPGSEMNDKGIVPDGREFRFPYDVVMGEAAHYESLADFQGSTLLYFYGVHEVSMPWGEPAWVLALEWIPWPNLYVVNEALVYGGETKYRDVELYTRLATFQFRSALETLLTAHKRDILHHDVREHNILIDEVNNQAVLIDWTADRHIGRGPRSAWVASDIDRIVHAFLPWGSQPHVEAIRALVHVAGLASTSDLE